MNVVFTTCVRYNVDKIRPFVESCRKFVSAEIYVFCANVSTSVLSYLKKENINIVPWHGDKTYKEDCVIKRFGHYLKYINEVGMTFDYAMFSDIRDVIFQDDPFRLSKEPYHIKVFEEECKFEESALCKKWMRNSYGEAIFDDVKEKSVLCSGTTFASFDGAIEYLEKMNFFSAALNVNFFGVDQSVHNYIVYNNKLSGVRIVPNRKGEVQTMGCQTKFLVDDQGRLLNDDGIVCPVLHQYDRHVLFGRHMLEANGYRESMLVSRKRLLKHILKLTLSKYSFT